MGRVVRAEYRRDDERFPYDTDEPQFAMDALELVISCPVCDVEHGHELDADIEQDAAVVCPTCNTQYYILPFVRDRHDSLVDRIEQQLHDVARVHPIAEKRYGALQRLPPEPKFFLLDALGVVVGIATVGTLFFLFMENGFLSPAVLAFFVLIAVGLFVACFGVMQGFWTVYKAWRWYREAGFDGSFIAFLVAVGNYYHEHPYSF